MEFPPINEVIRWQDLFTSFNKIALISVLALAIASILMFIASRRDPLQPPRGIRNLVESTVSFVENIVLQGMGRDGLPWTPFILALFIFIYLCNLPGILPIFQMPATARMAIPFGLAIMVWVTFLAVGMKHQGPLGYFKGIAFPPGVPKPIYVILTPIELISTILVRPFSLAIRLFANMLAGHLLLVSFAVITAALATLGPTLIIFPFSFGLLVFLTTFEVLVAFLQAYIFTILAAVYIADAMHPAH
jgi:F-type H+-transporting ATPase subunit a